jgi:exopolysaccharide production protein ExoQ
VTDIRRSALMIFLVAVLLLSTGAFAPLWTDTSAHDVAIDGAPVLQMLWAVLYAITIVLLIPHARSVANMIAGNKSLTLLLFLCLLSAAWSDNPAVTLRKSIAILGTTCVGLLLAVKFDLRGQLRLLAMTLGIVALASLLAALFFPGHFPTTEIAPAAWNGIFSHKNLLGRSMSLGAVAFLCLPRRSLAQYLLSVSGTVLCLALLAASHSQTALVVFVAMAFLMLLTHLLRMEWRQSLGTTLVALVVSAPIFWIALSHSSSLVALLGRDPSFTGRTRIWQVASISFFQRPWLGYGYGAFWWVSNQSRQALALIGYPTPHAHNGFLDLGLQLGAIGIAAFTFAWMLAIFGAVRHLRRDGEREARWPLLCLLFTVLYSITESSLLAPNSLLWILFVAACASIVRQHYVKQQVITRLQTLIPAPAPTV